MRMELKREDQRQILENELNLKMKETASRFEALSSVKKEAIQSDFTEKGVSIINRFKKVLSEPRKDESYINRYYQSDRGIYVLQRTMANAKTLLQDLKTNFQGKQLEKLIDLMTFEKALYLQERNWGDYHHDVWASIQSYDPKISVILYIEVRDDTYPSFVIWTHTVLTNLNMSPDKLSNTTLRDTVLMPALKEIYKRPLTSEEERLWIAWFDKVQSPRSVEDLDFSKTVDLAASLPDSIVDQKMRTALLGVIQRMVKKTYQKMHLCQGCGSLKLGVKWCACFQVRYCGRDCQRKDWDQHQLICTKVLAKGEKKKRVIEHRRWHLGT